MNFFFKDVGTCYFLVVLMPEELVKAVVRATSSRETSWVAAIRAEGVVTPAGIAAGTSRGRRSAAARPSRTRLWGVATKREGSSETESESVAAAVRGSGIVSRTESPLPPLREPGRRRWRETGNHQVRS